MFVISGGGTGIGAALAIELSRREFPVLIIGRHEKTLLQTAAHSKLISICIADVSTVLGREQIINCLRDIKKIQALVHNAATIEPLSQLEFMTQANWHLALETNLNAPLFLTQALLAKLNEGRVLHISSGAAHEPVGAWGAYCVSKAALTMLTRCWQIERQKPAFASVMPGIVDTQMQALVRHNAVMDKEKTSFFQRLKSEKRLVTPETVASFLTWLLLDLDSEMYSSKEWDIYDKSHHQAWLKSPHTVPSWED